MKRLLNQAVRRYKPEDICKFGLSIPSWGRLFAGLFLDRRVGMAPRLILLGALAYVFSLVDISPDFIPFLGQLDDLTVLTLAGRFFLKSCPPAVVTEHAARIRGLGGAPVVVDHS